MNGLIRQHAKIYQTLESYGLPFYSRGYQVKKMVFYPNDAVAIDMQFYKDTLLLNPNTYFEDSASENCPYLRNPDRLYVQKANFEKQSVSQIV